MNLKDIHDPKTGAHQGRTVILDMGSRTVHLHLLANLMPVNFLYYGVPSETMNRVMSELLEMAALPAHSHARGAPLPARLLAPDPRHPDLIGQPEICNNKQGERDVQLSHSQPGAWEREAERSKG